MHDLREVHICEQFTLNLLFEEQMLNIRWNAHETALLKNEAVKSSVPFTLFQYELLTFHIYHTSSSEVHTISAQCVLKYAPLYRM